MKVTIKSEDGTAAGCDVSLEGGGSIAAAVQTIDIRVRPGDVITAQIKFALPKINTLATVTVSEEHLRELCQAHGFDLVKRK